MHRRTLLKLGIGATVILVAAGGGVALLNPALSDGRLSHSARAVMHAVARAVLDGALPPAADEQEKAIEAHLQRLDAAIADFPSATQAELSQLLALLAAAPGRVALAGLTSAWSQASVTQVQASLQGMRLSSGAEAAGLPCPPRPHQRSVLLRPLRVAAHGLSGAVGHLMELAP
jgi:hypothetical protein